MKLEEQIAQILAERIVNTAKTEAPVDLAHWVRVLNELMERDESGVCSTVVSCFLMRCAERLAAMMLSSTKVVDAVMAQCPEVNKGIVASIIAPGMLMGLGHALKIEFEDDYRVFKDMLDSNPKAVESIANALVTLNEKDEIGSTIRQVKEAFKRNSESNLN